MRSVIDSRLGVVTSERFKGKRESNSVSSRPFIYLITDRLNFFTILIVLWEHVLSRILLLIVPLFSIFFFLFLGIFQQSKNDESSVSKFREYVKNRPWRRRSFSFRSFTVSAVYPSFLIILRDVANTSHDLGNRSSRFCWNTFLLFKWHLNITRWRLT